MTCKKSLAAYARWRQEQKRRAVDARFAEMNHDLFMSGLLASFGAGGPPEPAAVLRVFRMLHTARNARHG